MNRVNLEETHRTAKAFLDSEKAETPAEALEILERLKINIVVGSAIQSSRNAQAALLTAVNAGARTFKGGVFVSGRISDARLLLNVPGGRTLADTLELYGGELDFNADAKVTLLIGDALPPGDWEGMLLRVTWQHWCSRVGPDGEIERLVEDDLFAPAAVHAAATALSEAFLHLTALNLMAGGRDCFFSLYRPDFYRDPLSQHGPNAPLLLPQNLWLLGLGHLGQAYLWNLMMLRYPLNEMPIVLLQDSDIVSDATLSTGLLSFEDDLGFRKTHVMSLCLQDGGFHVRIVDRKFDGTEKLQEGEPMRLLCGLDNGPDRQKLEVVGFSEIIDAGLGSRAGDFFDYELRVFPSTKKAFDLFATSGPQDLERRLLEKQPYKKLLEKHDQCGVAALADKAVGAPFVGAAVGSLVIAEAIRSTMNEPRFLSLSGSMDSQTFSSFLRGPTDPHNLGFIEAVV